MTLSDMFSSINVPGSVDPSWVLIEEGFTLAREREVESLFTLSNGYVGTRGSLPEGTSLSAPATLLAGVYEAIDPSAGSLELANLPDWTRLQILVEGRLLSLESGEIVEHRRVLPSSRIVVAPWRHPDRTGGHRCNLCISCRFMMTCRTVGVTPENYAGTIAIEVSGNTYRGTVWRPRLRETV